MRHSGDLAVPAGFRGRALLGTEDRDVAGMAFPYYFEFVPSSKSDNGDPIDVLVLMVEPAFPDVCSVAARLE